MTVVMTLLCLMAWADNNQTVVVGGTVADKYASQLTFDGHNVTITFEDGTAQTAVSGQYLGSSVETMPKGLYIVNGKKVVIK